MACLTTYVTYDVNGRRYVSAWAPQHERARVTEIVPNSVAKEAVQYLCLLFYPPELSLRFYPGNAGEQKLSSQKGRPGHSNGNRRTLNTKRADGAKIFFDSFLDDNIKQIDTTFRYNTQTKWGLQAAAPRAESARGTQRIIRICRVAPLMVPHAQPPASNGRSHTQRARRGYYRRWNSVKQFRRRFEASQKIPFVSPAKWGSTWVQWRRASRKKIIDNGCLLEEWFTKRRNFLVFSFSENIFLYKKILLGFKPQT